MEICVYSADKKRTCLFRQILYPLKGTLLPHFLFRFEAKTHDKCQRNDGGNSAKDTSVCDRDADRAHR